MLLVALSLMYGVRSDGKLMGSPVFLPRSSANSFAAESICFRLLMQAFACARARALTKLGIAIAASSPIMATTIMISTRVKPALWEVLFPFM